MYGHLNIVLKNYVTERHGKEKWNTVLERVHHNGEFSNTDRHDDQLTSKLIDASCKILEFKRDVFLTLLGEYFVEYLKKYDYEELVRNLGANILEFVQNLDWVQTYLKEEYQDVIPPSFRCDDDSVSDRMVLHYYSFRPGYSHFVRGFISAQAKTMYQMELAITQISASVESVAAEHGFREHIILSIVAKKIEIEYDEGPPTFVAQTKKHAESQISKSDVEAVRIKLEQIRQELGDEALPVAKYRSAKAKWKAIAKLSLLSRGFVPNYPQYIAINSRLFIEIFPFHIVFDSEMKVFQSGIQIQRMVPSIRSRLAKMTDFFTLKYPRCTEFSFDNVKRFLMSPFTLEMNKNKMAKDFVGHYPFALKGQMFMLLDRNFFFFICSPLVRSWHDLEQHKMKLAEIPMWDATRDFLLTELSYRILRTDSSFMPQIETEHHRLLMLGGGSVDERLKRMQKDLENEQHKNDMLYHAFLPRQVADLVRAGKTPSGEYHSECTAMFCDVVHFIHMVANCKPNDVVGVLNSLYTRFDQITRVHDTYRVESIGDAYFVVSGLPEKIPNHADRIANTALGMMIVAQEVASPLNGEKIMIRIGIHTGSMVCGVVGRRLPRFVVLGETAVVASKMESHGEPGRIHLSPSTYRMLKGKGFMLQDRGKIELKGFGYLGTYFLVGNENASEEDLIGGSKMSTADIKFINEGRVDARGKHSKVTQIPSSGVGSRPPTGYTDVVTFAY